MSTINRNKILDKAQKYVQQGKLAKAVEEYLHLVQDDPSDVRTLLKVGDLYSRMGNIDAGLKTYQQVADHYSKDGFFLKAVAVYKQMLKLDPSAIAIYTRLAELYHQLALNNEALKQYQVVAKHYETKGMKKESLDIYRKMTELDPDNLASRIKLAELYAREGQTQQAMTDYLKLADDLRNKGNHEDLIKVYEKIIKIDTNNVSLVRELAALYLETGEPKRALAKLQVCFKQDAKNERTLSLLAKAFVDLQQPEKARAVYAELIVLYEEKGMADKAAGIRTKLASDGDLGSGVISEPANKSVKSVAAPVVQPPPPSPAEVAQLDQENTAPKAKPLQAKASPEDKLMTDVEVYLRYGLHEKAIQALQTMLSKHPENTQARQKLAELFMQSGNLAGAANALITIADVAQKNNQNTLATAILGEVLSIDPEHVGAMQRLQSLQSQDSAALPQFAPEQASMVDAGVAEVAMTSTSEPTDDLPERAVTEMHPLPVNQEVSSSSLNAAGLETAALNLDEPAPAASGDSGVVDLSADFGGLEVAAAEPATADFEAEMLRTPDRAADAKAEVSQIQYATPKPQSITPQMDSDQFTIERDDEPQMAIPVAKAPAAKVTPPPPEPEISFDLSVEVEAEPIAIEVAEPEPKPSKKTRPQPEPEPVAELEPEPEAELDIPASKPKKKVESLRLASPKAKRDPFTHEIEEARYFIEQGLIDEARGLIEDILGRDPKHREATALAAKLQERAIEVHESRGSMEREEVAAGAEDFFDLSLELKEEIDNINRLDQKVKEEGPPSFDQVFSAFKKGIKKTLSDDETEAHYNLGIAYKEMGLLTDAISEFNLAIKDARLSLDACVLIGICYRELGHFPDAEASFRKAIESVEPEDERWLGMKYELAEVHVAANKPKVALSVFKEVYQHNQSFRDVSHRIKQLAEQLEGGVEEVSVSGEKKDAGKKSKISYL